MLLPASCALYPQQALPGLWLLEGQRSPLKSLIRGVVKRSLGINEDEEEENDSKAKGKGRASGKGKDAVGTAMDEAAVATAAKAIQDAAAASAITLRCYTILCNLIQALKRSMDVPFAGALNTTTQRDMRIMVSTDSNSAVNNLLISLDNDAAFKASGYSLVRLGKVDKVRCTPGSCCCSHTSSLLYCNAQYL